MGHALQRVVDHDRKMIARRHVLARQHDIAPARRAGPPPQCSCPSSSNSLYRDVAADRRQRPVHVEPQHMRLAGRDPRLGLAATQAAAAAGIERCAVRVARPGLGRSPPPAPRPPAAPAGASRSRDRPALAGADRRAARAIIVEMLRLPPDRRLEANAEPGEILTDRLLEFGPAAGEVDILDPQQQPAAEPRGEPLIDQRRQAHGRDAAARSGSARSGRPACADSGEDVAIALVYGLGPSGGQAPADNPCAARRRAQRRRRQPRLMQIGRGLSAR